MTTSPPNWPGSRPATAARVVSCAIGVLSAVLCVIIGVVAWGSAHVTYALPDAVGHDVLASRIFAAVVAWLMAVAALVAVLLMASSSARSRRWVWLAIGALAAAVVVNLLVGLAPTPVY